MSAEFDDIVLTEIRETISRLQGPVHELSEILALLCAPLYAIGLLPPAYHSYNTKPYSRPDSQKILKNIPILQSALLDTVVPAWYSSFKEQSLEPLLFVYFCPDVFFSASNVAGRIAVLAYSSILNSPLSDFSIDVLCRLGRFYPIDQLHAVVFAQSSAFPAHGRANTWVELVRNILSVPTKVANARGLEDVPEDLSPHTFQSRLCLRVEQLVLSSASTPTSEILSSLTHLVTKMINVGLFPSTAILAPSQTSFFAMTLSTIRTRFQTLSGNHLEIYSKLWIDVWESLPITLLSTVYTSLFTNLSLIPDGFDTSSECRGLIKREARFVSRLIGFLEDEGDEKWQSITSVLLTRKWDITIARILVTWAAISDENAIPPKGVETLLTKVMSVWSSSEHIKHSLLPQHQYITTIILLTVLSFPSNAPPVQSLAFSTEFISAISTFISHLDPAVRRCGMLAAEIVAKQTGKSLNFEQWEGQGQGQEWARKVRVLITGRDVDATEAAYDVARIELDDNVEASVTVSPSSTTTKKQSLVQVVNSGYDSDDSLVGYASSPTSSRSPSPTPSELDEMERDATLRLGKKRIQKPVYLADLGNMLRGSAKSDDAEQADRIEVALNCAEELIRRKRNYGLELEENAVNLVYALVGLQNNFELDGFDEKRQGAVTALVVCSPKKAVPAIIDEYFKNQYSTAQRFVMLNAMALGARELASLPVPASLVDAQKIAFPSKQLPQPLHRKLISYEKDHQGSQVQRMLDDISQAAIESGKNAAEEKVPEIVRSRQLRIKKPTQVTEVIQKKAQTTFEPKVDGSFSFAELAAEYFLGPLIGKFWLFLRDEQAREERSAYRTYAYHAAGTGLILSPLVLAHFLGTVGVLMHAARHSSAYLSVLAPDALELAVTLGTRPMSSAPEEKEKEAAVLTASLELALIVLDGCLDLDGGRSLGLDHPSLLVSTGEWAGHVLEALESGVRVQGGGGSQELRLRRSAAGVVLKVDELSSKWRQSMIAI